MSTSGEKLIAVYIDYLYSPLFIYNKLNELLKVAALGHKLRIKPLDKLAIPFTLDQISMFLESCASLMFFLQKNDILKIESLSYDQDVRLTSEIFIKEVLDYDCLRAFLHFSPEHSRKHEILYEIELRKLEEYNEDDDLIAHKKRVQEFECIASPYSEKDITTLGYYPRSVGYSAPKKELRLERFKLSKELKREDLPLYVNMPYVQDYVTYFFSKPKK